jgi:hypothetical protein
MRSITYTGRLVVPACESKVLTVAVDAGFTLEKLRVKLAKKRAVLVGHVAQKGREVDIGFMNTTTFARALSFIIEGTA